MIAVGTDIVEVARISAALDRHGARFVSRILTAEERERFAATRFPERYLAKRFAAKEAVAKALGTGIGIHLSWQDLTIGADAHGAPLVHLTPRASAVAARRGGGQVLLSLSDERAYAVAFAALLA